MVVFKRRLRPLVPAGPGPGAQGSTKRHGSGSGFLWVQDLRMGPGKMGQRIPATVATSWGVATPGPCESSPWARVCTTAQGTAELRDPAQRHRSCGHQASGFGRSNGPIGGGGGGGLIWGPQDKSSLACSGTPSCSAPPTPASRGWAQQLGYQSTPSELSRAAQKPWLLVTQLQVPGHPETFPKVMVASMRLMVSQVMAPE